MNQVKLHADVVDVARRAEDRWYVTTGHTAVGPVNLDLIARGVEAGKVPLEAFVRHEAWKVWRPLSDLGVIESDGPESTDDIADTGRISISGDFQPADAIDGASDRRGALTLLMTAAVVRGCTDVGIVHEVDDEGAWAVCAHGPAMSEALGMRTPLDDAALVAAAAGVTVVAEPSPGPAGQAILARLSKLAGGIALEGVIMTPIRTGGRLNGMLELGRKTPFKSAEIASIEALVAALADKPARWAGE